MTTDIDKVLQVAAEMQETRMLKAELELFRADLLRRHVRYHELWEARPSVERPYRPFHSHSQAVSHAKGGAS